MAWITPLQEPMNTRSPATAGEEKTQPPVSYCHRVWPRVESAVGGDCSADTSHDPIEIASQRAPGRTPRESLLIVHHPLWSPVSPPSERTSASLPSNPAPV